MIKFFSQIRYKLLSQNKTGKYLKYAIGEIILVVIGILIALQVNNWNETRISNANEHIYLNSLKNSISRDTSQINFRLKDLTRTLSIIDSLTTILPSTNSKKDLAELLPILYLSTFNLSIETAVIEDLKSTGNLSLIRNKELSQSLLEYYNLVNSQQIGISDSNNTYTRQTLGPYLMKNYSLEYNGRKVSPELQDRYALSLVELKEDLLLVNALGYRYTILNGLKSNYSDLLRDAVSILTLIEKEI